MSDIKPFEYTLTKDIKYPCKMCKIYEASIVIISPISYIGLCRICLKRMRASLKLVEKILPILPKRVIPKE